MRSDINQPSPLSERARIVVLGQEGDLLSLVMAMSTFQKVTLATCLVLCVGLLLPKMLLSRGRKDAAERPEGPGRLPPMMHRQAAPEGRGQRAAAAGFSRAHNTEAIARAKGAGTGAGTGGKSNLAGQIIPVYGFGILLYILYILFKITSKGNSKPSESRFPSVRSENMKRKITDFELAQLQEKLRETELVMENIVSNAHHSPERLKGVSADQEESLLQQLTEITRVMQEGQLVDDVTPEKKDQDDWEDYPEEPQQPWEHSRCCCQHSQQHHSPQAEPEAERTQADGADVENIHEDITGGGEAEETEAVKESNFTAVSEADVGPDSVIGLNESLREHKDGGGKIDLGVPEEDLAGVLEELELSLKMTSMMEQEKMEHLSRSTETETSCSTVRRRNKRRRAKKASH
ncbi:protein RIC-3b [Acanthopagrus latus]|uniref:protein RIC-3b n=1 Tax=Acanthopagrus latus TaxID=8177 RepID=UPI00187BFE03|nr:protein RIC-3b [Acanthopagrus latus]